MVEWTIELEPEVGDWLESLATNGFGTVAFHLDRLGETGAALRMPHSRALGDGLYEFRYDMEREAWRIAFFLHPAPDRPTDGLSKATHERTCGDPTGASGDDALHRGGP
ncbi:MAG: type II toxin-antitoxin system RelE/ParE family toxin [Acidimicrobiales bacterium]